MSKFTVKINPKYYEYIDSSIIRLAYLFADYEFKNHKSNVLIESKNTISQEQKKTLQKEVNYQIYREKIYTDTLAIREGFYSSRK